MTRSRINIFRILAVSGVRGTSFDIKIRNKFTKIKYSAPNRFIIFITNDRYFTVLEIFWCHGLLKNSHATAEDRTGDPSIYSLTLYHVAIKAGLYRKAVQVYYIPNLYPVTFSPSILNSSSNSQKYKNHWK